MINSNIKSGTFIRGFVVTNSDGTLADRQDCQWVKVATVKCGLFSNVSDKLIQRKEFETNLETRELTFDSKDQDMQEWDIRKTDYLAFVLNGDEDKIKFYKVVAIMQNDLICGCTFKLLLDRAEPRDCGITIKECEKLITAPVIYE